MNRIAFAGISFLILLAPLACVDEPRANVTAINEPLNVQLFRAMPALKTQRYSTILDFETDTDSVFINSNPPARMVYDRAHTGRRSLRVDRGTQRITFKLGSLLSGRTFPGDWTLLGAFIYCDEPISVSMSVEHAGIDIPPREVPLSAGKWTTTLLDLSTVAKDEESDISPDAQLIITLPPNAPPIWCDDVLLINNVEVLVQAHPATQPAQPLIATTNPATNSISQAAENLAVSSETWSVERRGLNYIADVPGKFNLQLITADASRAGWSVEESNELRARFISADGAHHLTIYKNGRSYRDGQFSPLTQAARDDSSLAEMHVSPAEIVVPEDQGRVDRQTEGDQNNDGYNERRGTYTIIASGSRIELKIAPHTSKLAGPVLEISGLPTGKILTTVEGRLVEGGVRLNDGTFLVELPVTIDRPTTVNLRLQ